MKQTRRSFAVMRLGIPCSPANFPRPAIANERLKRNHAGQVVLQLKSPYKDGTTHVVMEPLEFMERLAALVPPPTSPSDPVRQAQGRPVPRRAGTKREVAQ
jgi:hypothetical protein